MKRSDEEHCRVAFDRFLEGENPASHREWCEVPADQEPPDYYLTLGAERYAVEVTSVVEFVDVLPKPLSQITLNQSAERLVHKAEAIASRQGILSGAYAVYLGPIDNFAAHRESLLQAIVEYVRRTAALPSAPAATLHKGSGRHYDIRKVSATGSLIGLMFSEGAKWQVEARDELHALLRAAVTRKARLLCGLRPACLLLLDRYLFADAGSWLHAASSIERNGLFSLIARVGPEGKLQVLKGWVCA